MNNRSLTMLRFIRSVLSNIPEPVTYLDFLKMGILSEISYIYNAQFIIIYRPLELQEVHKFSCLCVLYHGNMY